MTKDEAVDKLAARLFWNMERHDPTMEQIPEWESVADGTKEIYRVLIRDILEFDLLIEMAMTDKPPWASS